MTAPSLRPLSLQEWASALEMGRRLRAEHDGAAARIRQARSGANPPPEQPPG